MKPVDDVRQISALTYGFIASKALFAALDLDLFTKIAGGATTLADLATATGTAPNRLRTLLTALKTIGLVSESDGAVRQCAGGRDLPRRRRAGRFPRLHPDRQWRLPLRRPAPSRQVDARRADLPGQGLLRRHRLFRRRRRRPGLQQRAACRVARPCPPHGAAGRPRGRHEVPRCRRRQRRLHARLPEAEPEAHRDDPRFSGDRPRPRAATPPKRA